MSNKILHIKTIVTSLDIGIFILALLGIFSLNPFFIWGWGSFCQAALLIVSFVFLIFGRYYFSLNSLVWGGLAGFLTFYFYLMVGASLYGAIYFSLFFFLLMQLKINEIINCFCIFKGLFVITLIPGLFLWLVHHGFNDFSLFSRGYVDSTIIPNQLKVDIGQGYALYPFTVVLDYMLYYPIYRLHGPYDEPGLVGTISALILISDNFNVKSISNCILIFAGLVSFSLAFYLLTFVWLFFNYLHKPIPLLVLLSICITAILFLPENEFKIKIVYRLAISEGQLAGDNRTNAEFDEMFDLWKSSSFQQVMFGISTIENTGSSSWKRIPLQTGIIGCFVFILVLIIFAFRFSSKLNKSSLIFLFIFILSIYQRPFVLIPAYILILIVGVAINNNVKTLES